MTFCEICGNTTSQPVTGIVFKGQDVMKEGKQICRPCFDKMIAKAREDDERKDRDAYCANNKRSRKTQGCKLVQSKLNNTKKVLKKS